MKTIKEESFIEGWKARTEDVLDLIDEINEINFKGNIKGKVLLISKEELKARINGEVQDKR